MRKHLFDALLVSVAATILASTSNAQERASTVVVPVTTDQLIRYAKLENPTGLDIQIDRIARGRSRKAGVMLGDGSAFQLTDNATYDWVAQIRPAPDNCYPTEEFVTKTQSFDEPYANRPSQTAEYPWAVIRMFREPKNGPCDARLIEISRRKSIWSGSRFVGISVPTANGMDRQSFTELLRIIETGNLSRTKAALSNDTQLPNASNVIFSWGAIYSVPKTKYAALVTQLDNKGGMACLPVSQVLASNGPFEYSDLRPNTWRKWNQKITLSIVAKPDQPTCVERIFATFLSPD